MWASFIGALLSLFAPANYGSELEDYVMSRNPQSVYDVEKYALDYQRKKWL